MHVIKPSIEGKDTPFCAALCSGVRPLALGMAAGCVAAAVEKVAQEAHISRGRGEDNRRLGYKSDAV